MMIIVSFKYVMIIMCADKKGEGGSLALLSLITRTLSGERKWTGDGDMVGVFATALFDADFMRAFIAMGSVVLAVTGAEALYADMGHFGRKPIRISWVYFVLPALLLNYMGQGAMILSADPATALAKVKDPFFYLAPDQLRLPLVLLATAATIIASQAVISGAFSVTQQAIQLGFVPRLRITHTVESAAGH